MQYVNVEYRVSPEQYRGKESRYLQARDLEGRVLDDSAVKLLPNVSKSSPYRKEWLWRRRSFSRLNKYLQKNRQGRLTILDLGCGNGWMANRMAENPNWLVTAVDLNSAELEQGARLFGRENLRFVYADILEVTDDTTIATGAFDIILLAASVQYFPDLAELFHSLFPLLKEKGEIHLIDSHFYPDESARLAARERTLAYYAKVGVQEMAAYYHHHLWPEIQQLGGENLNKRLNIKLLQKAGYLAPFPWIRVQRHGSG